MKKVIVPALAAIFILVGFANCGKSGGDGGCSESAMTVTTLPANGSVEAPAPGPTFPVQINITANMPASGVNIEIKAHPENSTANFFTMGPTQSNSATNNFTITGTQSGVPCVVDITVTSRSCATNKWTGSYKYSMK